MTDAVYRNWLRDELFESAPLDISVVDRNLRIVAANRNFVDQFGEAEGRPCHEVHMGRDEPCEGCPVELTFADGKPRVNEGEGVDRHGRPTHYQVHVAPIRAPDGSIPYVIEMATDVTASKELELEYRTLFEQVPCYVTVVDRDLVLRRANARFADKFGEHDGQRCYEMFKHRGDPCETCPARETFEDGLIHCAEQVGVSRDGEETHYIVTTAPASRKSGEVDRVIEMALDVTELRRVEQARIDAERLAAVGQTVAGLAHGIKNILTGLEGGMYFLRSGLEGGRKQRLDEGWGMLERNMERISVLVRNLLSFSKGRTPRVETLDPARFVTEMKELYEQAAARESIAVVPVVEGEPAPANLDAEAIHDCLANLVSNAIDACRMGDRTPCRVFVRVRDEGDVLVFEVEDEGCGMDQKVRDLAFTNFFTTKGAGGTGLGLLITRKITQEHGGRIEFETTPDVGSLFRLVFPRDRLPKPDAGGETRRQA